MSKDARGRPRKKTNNSRPRRPRMATKEELEQYLSAHPESEYPLVEEVWEKAIQTSKDNEQKIIEAESNGEEPNKRVAITNPVSIYFKLMGLAQNRKKGIALQEETFPVSEDKQQILDTYFNEDSEEDSSISEFTDEIISWINLFKPVEREYLKQRYASYYNNYEINDGADKASLKRVLSLEIELYRIDLKRANGQKVDPNDEKKYTELLNGTFESLKWTKKQRNARDEARQNKFTLWMDNMDKDGDFIPDDIDVPKDEVDYLLEEIVENQKKMLL